jgi:hypothetical protein
MRLHNFHFAYTFSSIFCTSLPFLYWQNYDSFVSHVSVWICDFSLQSSYASTPPLLITPFVFLLFILILCFNLLLGLDRAVCPACFVYPCRLYSIRNIHCHEGASFSYSVAAVMKNSTSPTLAFSSVVAVVRFCILLCSGKIYFICLEHNK